MPIHPSATPSTNSVFHHPPTGGMTASTALHQPSNERTAVSNAHVALSLQADKQSWAQDLESLSPAAHLNDTVSALPLLHGPNSHSASDYARDVLQRQLIAAASSGDLDSLAAAAATAGPGELNPLDSEGNTPLMLTIWRRNTAAAKKLVHLMTPADLNLFAKDNQTALMLAASRKHVDIVKLIVEKLNTPEAINLAAPDGTTALTIAIGNGQLDIVKVLASKLTRAEIHKPGPGGLTPLMLAVKSHQINPARVLHASMGAYRGTTVEQAVSKAQLSAVNVLVARLTAAQINQPGPDGNTALTLAARLNKPICVEVLAKALSSPDNINYRRSDGMTALMVAASCASDGVVSALLKSLNTPEAINQTLPDGRTALMLAVASSGAKSSGTVEALVKALRPFPGSINVFAADGRTALSIAHDRGRHDLVTLLLNELQTNGRAANTSDAMDQLTLRIAGGQGHKGLLIRWLTSGVQENFAESFLEGCDAASKGPNVYPALMLEAAEAGHALLVSMLLQRGTAAHVAKADGQGVLALAAKNGHFSVMNAWAANGHGIPQEVILKTPQGRRFEADSSNQNSFEKFKEEVIAHATANGWTHLVQALSVTKR
ncbi:ankyrin repeat domain-containing protein [Ottowia thiooxydans]|uniref:Ankyrin repeat protein n=1 Tax=Ottowia thiooxydans TaxID=219182 RepID=A0ABV2Q7I9_9BURK